MFYNLRKEKNKKKARMVKTHRIQGRQSILSCALCIGGFRVLLKKSLLVFSIFVFSLTWSAVAAVPEGYTEYNTFPTMTGTDYMKEKSVYKNAAIAINMLGITEGEIIAEPVFLITSCPENQYLTDDNACENLATSLQ